MSYYGVKKGRNPGIYLTWAECQREVKGFAGAEFKKFKTKKEAEDFIGGKLESRELKVVGACLKDGHMAEREIEELGENEAVAYVDGSFDEASFSYSYGLVYLTRDSKEIYSGRYTGDDLVDMRNVSGELRGAMEAMKLARLKNHKKLYLHYDYMGIEQWALGNWKTNKDGTKKYKEFYDGIKNHLDVVFIKVKAHSGIKYNEEADQLAKNAL